MKTIEEHIDKDKHLIEDATISAAARRHYKEELHELEVYAEHHKTCYKTTKELYKLFSNRQYFDVVGDNYDIVNDKINATSSYNDGWTQQYYKDKLKERGITTTKINIEVPDHPDYTELDD